MRFRFFVLKVVAIFLLCSVFSSFIIAEEKVDLTIGIMNFPPFSNVNEKDDPTGVFIDMMELSLTKAGITHSKIKGYPPKRHYSYLGSGETQFSIGSKNVPYYHESVIYSKMPAHTVECYVMSLPDQPLPPQDPKEWKGKVILMTGYDYGRLRNGLEKLETAGQLQLINAPAHINLMKMLKAKRGDYALDYAGPTEKALEVVDIPNIQKRTVFAVDLFFMLNKNIPNASGLMDRIEKAFLDLKAEGKFEQ
ncbi:transporter substrate-binding domain-containing protein [bacterium]|nr:transporter substrate-binding domain-containing protein [bacterium]